MNKINSNAFGLACGISWVIGDVIFLSLIIISPQLALNLISRLALVNLTALTTVITWGNIILSIVGGFLAGYIAGVIFAFIYNAFNKIDEVLEHHHLEHLQAEMNKTNPPNHKNP